MAAQLEALGLEWERVAAHDMNAIDAEVLAREVSPDGHVRDMGPGSQCCALTNFDIYRRIVAEDIPAALILQDDVELAAEIAPFLASLDWCPPDVHLVQFEKYGSPSSLRLIGPALGKMPVAGQNLHRMLSRTGGAACYLITKEGAARVLAEKPLLRMPIDHLLFSPNISPVFDRLGTCIMVPALARQYEGGFASDINVERERRRKSLGSRMRRFWQEINKTPAQLGAMMRGARWQKVGYINAKD